MQKIYRIVGCFALLMAGCRNTALDRQLVGDWRFSTLELREVMLLQADHTFSDKVDILSGTFETNGAGTWRTDRNQLVLHFTSAGRLPQESVGSTVRYTISDLTNDAFTMTNEKIRSIHFSRAKPISH